MTIVCDATSLILLAKVGLLEIFANRNKPIVPKLVYEEVRRGVDKGRGDSMLVDRLITEKWLIIKSQNRLAENEIMKLLHLRGGELAVISLAFRAGHTVLTDDKKCLNAAKALNIDFITSLDVVSTLYAKKAIHKEKALECIGRLEEYGWYSRDLIKSYREALK